MSILKKPVLVTVIVLIAFAALIAGVFVAQHMPDKSIFLAEQFKGTLLDKPRTIKPFALTGIDESPFTNQSMQGHWTFLFFGFTNCGSICPVTMAELGKMYRILEKHKVRALPNVVMISIDPARDTLSKLANYVKAFDPHFYGVRGSSKSVYNMASEMGIVYLKVAQTSGNTPKEYNIQHSGTVILFNPKGKLVAFFTPPTNAEALAEDYQLLVS